jgi:hypothetical protein
MLKEQKCHNIANAVSGAWRLRGKKAETIRV